MTIPALLNSSLNDLLQHGYSQLAKLPETGLARGFEHPNFAGESVDLSARARSSCTSAAAS